jgi:hypothetical protein
MQVAAPYAQVLCGLVDGLVICDVPQIMRPRHSSSGGKKYGEMLSDSRASVSSTEGLGMCPIRLPRKFNDGFVCHSMERCHSLCTSIGSPTSAPSTLAEQVSVISATPFAIHALRITILRIVHYIL